MNILGIIASSISGSISSSSYESIATATGTGSSGTITFSSIPSTYQHLQLRWISRSSRAVTADNMRVTFNSATSTYADHILYGDGASAAAAGQTALAYITLQDATTGASATSNIMGTGILDIHDYASTTKAKTLRSMHGNDRNGAGVIALSSGLWTSTSAITSITIVVGSTGNFTTATQFALYGIKGA